jgi:hypothetical protein
VGALLLELQSQGKVRSAQDGITTLLRHTQQLVEEVDLQVCGCLARRCGVLLS